MLENHFQLVRTRFVGHIVFLSWVGMASTGGPWNIALLSYFLDPLGFIAYIILEVENHGFHVGKPLPNCTCFLRQPLFILFMSGNGKYWRCVKFSIEVLSSKSPWIDCKIIFEVENHVFHVEKTFPTCTYFLYSTLYFSHECEWQLPGAVKYSIRGFYFGSPWIHCEH